MLNMVRLWRARLPPIRFDRCPDAMAQIVGRPGTGDYFSMRLGWREVA